MSEYKPSVLLIDDIEANLVALEALLDATNFDVVRAHNGNEALRQLLKRDFAVMLLDVQMPGMDGYEVAKYARANSRTKDVPIIFLTAMHDPGDAAFRAYGSGAVDFLLKPANPDILRAKVRVFVDLYLGKRKLADEVAAHQKTLSALEQANAALRHFTDAASHDLRAPLRTIRGFLEALEEHVGQSLDDEARGYLFRAARANDRMISLLNSLLAYARLQKPPASRRVDCSVILERVRGDLGEQLAVSGASLNVGSLPTVMGDPDRLYQLFLNLIGNANKFRRPGESPRISVLAESKSGEWLFTVEDDGIGVDAEHAGAIFDSFHRLHSQSEYEGSGLGLMICRQIVEQHGGKIWVESALVRGSRFIFTLKNVVDAANAGEIDVGAGP
jgi:hypothetical protein